MADAPKTDPKPDAKTDSKTSSTSSSSSSSSSSSPKTESKTSSPAQKRSEELSGHRPVNQSGLTGPTQDDLNPAYDPRNADVIAEAAKDARPGDPTDQDVEEKDSKKS